MFFPGGKIFSPASPASPAFLLARCALRSDLPASHTVTILGVHFTTR